MSGLQLLELQRSAGNRAVSSHVRRHRTVRESASVPPERPDAAAPVAQRQVNGDVTTMSITPEWTRALTDPELASQLLIVRDQMRGLAPADTTRPAVEMNMKLLEAENERRNAAQALGGLQLGPHQARPAGVPNDGGYAIVALHDVPDAAVAGLPEGQVVDVDPATLYHPGAPAPLTPNDPTSIPQDVQAVGAGGGMGTFASGVNMARWGYPGGMQGGYSVGIVVRPRANPFDWGHTSLVLRRGAEPLDVVGFNPDMRTVNGLLKIARDYEQVELGTKAVPGRVTADSAMFTDADAIHVEFPLTEAQAAEFAMAKPGLAPHLDYVARPAVYRPAPGACTGSNCGLWAIGEIEAQTGGTVGRVGDPAGITSMGPPGTPPAVGRGSQPAIVEMARGGLSDPATISPLTPGGPVPVVSATPRVVRVLRVGGKVLLVVGIVAGAYEIYAAKPEEQARTAFGVAGGFAGGFLLGATAGLVCGPVSPVCSFVLGLGLGTLGALAGRGVTEAIYDAATAPSPMTQNTGSGDGSAPTPPEQWEFLFLPPPRPPGIIFLDVEQASPYLRPATSMDLSFSATPG